MSDYWDAKAAGTDFTHPIDLDWLGSLSKRARILDFGCGYGRVLSTLASHGWTNGVGIDFSRAMIARGVSEHPMLELRWAPALPIEELDDAFDAAMLFAVLTTMTHDAAAQQTMAELRRVLRPGGLLYLSDYGLQTDDRYLARYQAGLARHGVYGVWDRDDGGVFRHRSEAEWSGLLEGFDVVHRRDIATKTLSGAPAVALQVLARTRS